MKNADGTKKVSKEKKNKKSKKVKKGSKVKAASFHRGSRRARKDTRGGDGDARDESPPQEELQRSEALNFQRLKSSEFVLLTCSNQWCWIQPKSSISPTELLNSPFANSLSEIPLLSHPCCPLQVDGRYCGYDLAMAPRNAWPDPKKTHLGMHSYTVLRGAAKIEILLRNKAYFVRGPSEKKQFTWSKHGGPNSAWIAACTHAGVLP